MTSRGLEVFKNVNLNPNLVDRSTPVAMPVACNVEHTIRIENAWGAVILQIEELVALEDATSSVSLKAALATVQTRLLHACAAFHTASAIARGQTR